MPWLFSLCVQEFSCKSMLTDDVLCGSSLVLARIVGDEHNLPALCTGPDVEFVPKYSPVNLVPSRVWEQTQICKWAKERTKRPRRPRSFHHPIW
jgi:hypothetical protein